jgi:hypothetical protein
MLSHRDLGKYALSRIQPGADSIIASSIVELPDFDHPDELKRHIEVEIMGFIEDIVRVVDSNPARS